jgi:hypothetical protein
MHEDASRVFYLSYISDPLWPTRWLLNIKIAKDIARSAFRVQIDKEKRFYVYKKVTSHIWGRSRMKRYDSSFPLCNSTRCREIRCRRCACSVSAALGDDSFYGLQGMLADMRVRVKTTQYQLP